MSSSWDIGQIVESIETLYSSNDTSKIRQIQDHLQSLQKSDDGYSLGLLLLQHHSKSCKYFGALTITVFINTHLPQLNQLQQDQLTSLMDEILQLTLNLAQDLQSNLFIVKKNLSNIVLLFSHFYKQLDISALIAKLMGNSHLQHINENQLVLLITFYTILVEDISKSDHHSDFHKTIHSIFLGVSQLFAFVGINKPPSFISLLLLQCLNSWIIYISLAEHNSDQRYSDEEIAPLIQFLIHQFNTVEIIDNLETLTKSFQVLTEIFETIPKILIPVKPIIAQIFFDSGNLGDRFINQICNNEENSEIYRDEIDTFVNLLIAYLNLNSVYLSRNILDENVAKIIAIILHLSDFKGNPIADEKVSEQFLIFWEDFINIYIDDEQLIKESLKDNYPQFVDKRNEILTKLSLIYWNKCRFFENAPKQEFSHYRTQIADLFIVLYQLLNVDLYSIFTKSIINELNEFHQSGDQLCLNRIEASLYILFKITDDLTFYNDESTKALLPFIEAIFKNSLIETVDKHGANTPNLHITLLNLLSSVYFFFKCEPGSAYLADTFNFLFAIILVSSSVSSSSQVNLSIIASKTVLKICQDSQESLIRFLPNFRSIVTAMINNIVIDNLIRERMTNAYISICQSMKDPAVLGDAILNLLEEIIKISRLVEAGEIAKMTENLSYQLDSPEVHEKVEEYAISLTSCINEMGKASQLPEDVDDYLTVDQANQINSYWMQDPLNIKRLILECVKQFSLNISSLKSSNFLTEICCNILKDGLGEPINGPFKFDLGIIFEYLFAKIDNCDSSSITPIYKLLETIVITSSKELTPALTDQILGKLFLDQRAFFEKENDLIKSAMDLFRTFIERSPSLIIQLDKFQKEVINISLEAFNFHETYITKSVTKFWSAIVMLKRGNAADQQIFRSLMVDEEFQLGARLTEYLTVAFVTNHRSNLDQFYPIFRNLIAKYPMQFKGWFHQTLISKCLKEGKFSEPDATQLIAKLMVTRGQRQANDILKSFWLQINGLIDYK